MFCPAVKAMPKACPRRHRGLSLGLEVTKATTSASISVLTFLGRE